MGLIDYIFGRVRFAEMVERDITSTIADADVTTDPVSRLQMLSDAWQLAKISKDRRETMLLLRARAAAVDVVREMNL